MAGACSLSECSSPLEGASSRDFHSMLSYRPHSCLSTNVDKGGLAWMEKRVSIYSTSTDGHQPEMVFALGGEWKRHT